MTLPIGGKYFSTVTYSGVQYKGVNVYDKKKDAEKDAAQVALNALIGTPPPVPQEVFEQDEINNGEEEEYMVYVSHVESPLQFWGQLYNTELEEKLLTLTTSMEEICPTLPKLTEEPADGIHACQFSQDGLWYGCKVEKMKKLLADNFRMKDMVPISWFVGIKFVQGKHFITMSQTDYLANKVKKFGMDQAKPRATPCKISGYKCISVEEADTSMHREMIGSIIYAMTCTRPDLSWVVSKLSQNLNDPKPVEVVMLKHVFRYLLGTLNRSLTFTKSVNGLKLIGYSDADWATSTEDRKSISGYYFFVSMFGIQVTILVLILVYLLKLIY